jgi:hypothetical protein
MFRLWLCTAITNIIFKAEARCIKAVTPRQKIQHTLFLFTNTTDKCNTTRLCYSRPKYNAILQKKHITVACSLGLSSWTSPGLFVREGGQKTCLRYSACPRLLLSALEKRTSGLCCESHHLWFRYFLHVVHSLNCESVPKIREIFFRTNQNMCLDSYICYNIIRLLFQ